MATKTASLLGTLVITGTLLLASNARAEGVAIDRARPASAESSWFASDSVSFGGHLTPAAAVVGDYAHLPLVAYDSSGAAQARIVRESLVLHVGGSLTLFDRARIGVAVPFTPWQTGEAGDLAGAHLGAPGAGLGDVVLSSDVRLTTVRDGVARVALGVATQLPTGSRADYMGDGKLGVQPRALVAGTIGTFEYAASAGFLFREPVALGTVRFGDELRFSGAAGVHLLRGRLLIGPEVTSAVAVGGATSGHPTEGFLAAHWAMTHALTVGAGAGMGLVNAPGSPSTRGLLSLTWTPGAAQPLPAPTAITASR